MNSELKVKLLARVRDELRQAEEHMARWVSLKPEFRGFEDQMWESVLKARGSEVDSLKILIEQIEKGF